MEFDKTRVYTAVNADELKIGDLVIAALNLEELEHKAESEIDIQPLAGISDRRNLDRFGLDIYDDLDNLRYYPLAYLFKSFAELKEQKKANYKPFESADTAMEAIKKHGGWVKDKKNNVQLFVVGFDDDNAFFLGNGYSCSYTVLFLDYVFADDGSPCGELVDE